jgi:hypothetical protein
MCSVNVTGRGTDRVVIHASCCALSHYDGRISAIIHTFVPTAIYVVARDSVQWWLSLLAGRTDTYYRAEPWEEACWS